MTKRIREGMKDRSYSYVDTKTDTAYVKQGMSEEEYLEGIKERERIELDRINQPIDIEWLKSQVLIVEKKDCAECKAFENNKAFENKLSKITENLNPSKNNVEDRNGD